MNENGLTLEELVNYAQEAKEQTEKERLAQGVKKNEACIDIIKKIVDKLKSKGGQEVIVRATGAQSFNLDKDDWELPVWEVPVVITLDDIKAVIDRIPALEANFVDLDNEPITVLEVTFSETEPTELPIPEEVDEIEVTLLPIPEKILEVDGSEDK